MTKNKLVAIMLGAVLAVGTGAMATFSNHAVEANAAVGDFYMPITSLSDINTTDDYMFAYKKSDTAYAVMAATSTSSKFRTSVDANVSNGGIVATDGHAAIKFEAGTKSGDYKINVGGSYLYYTGSSNEVYTGSVTNTSAEWTFTYDNGFEATNVATTARILQYNPSNPRFACYKGTQNAFSILKKVDATAPTLVLNTNAADGIVGGSVTLTASTTNITEPTFTWSVTAGDTVVSLEDVAEHPEQKTINFDSVGSATVQVAAGELTAECTITVNDVLTVPEAKEIDSGETVYVEGIVGNITGTCFTLFTEDGEGLYNYLYDTNKLLEDNDIVAGDKIVVKGLTDVYYSVKQIKNVEFVSKVSSGNTYNAKVITAPTLDDVYSYAKFENALVTSVSTITVASNNYNAIKIKVGETVVTGAYYANSVEQPYANAYNTLANNIIPNLSTVNVTAYLTSYNSAVQFKIIDTTEIVVNSSELVSFSELFLALPCDDNGANYSSSWDVITSYYVENLSENEKTFFASANANAEGNIVEQAAARYDLLVTKYGFTDFANRAPAAASNHLGLINNTFNFTLLFVVAGIALAASVVAVVVIKAKKAN